MPLSSEYISTQEVAGLFKVTETTVKRWADQGIIPCVKSPGGHRKFRLPDIIGFAEKQGYPISGTLEPPLTEAQMEQVRFAIHTQNYHKIAEVLFDEALQADPEGLYQVLLYLSKHNVKLSTLADEVLRPPLVRIGELWKEGKLQIDQEHRTSRAITEAMIRLAPELHRKHSNGMLAVCACLEGERHEIGLRSMAFALETEGWTVHYLGADTPYRTVADYVGKVKPQLLAVSFTASKPDDGMRKGYATVARAVRGVGGKFVAGGFFADNFTTEDLSCDHVAGSIADGVAWVRDAFALRPGPRKKERPAAIVQPADAPKKSPLA
jgi:excisionase family DNA binding protein